MTRNCALHPGICCHLRARQSLPWVTMPFVTMMAFFMRCCERLQLKALRVVLLALLAASSLGAAAQTSGAPVQPLVLERSAGTVLLSTQLALELPGTVVDALGNGIPIYFVMSAKLVRERWYWTNQVLALTQRHTRLSYQPLTRRWRLSNVAANSAELGQGLSLDQSFDSLQEALAAISRVSAWRIAEGLMLSPDERYQVDFSFELDANQLPRPLQIGTLGQSDWRVAISRTQALEVKAAP